MSLYKLIQFIGFFSCFSPIYICVFLFSQSISYFPTISTNFLNSIVHPKLFQNCFTCLTIKNNVRIIQGILWFTLLPYPRWKVCGQILSINFFGFLPPFYRNIHSSPFPPTLVGFQLYSFWLFFIFVEINKYIWIFPLLSYTKGIILYLLFTGCFFSLNVSWKSFLISNRV